jgi:4-amino-4-deoxy-L-arabinose transferase-like glycosyltransferase
MTPTTPEIRHLRRWAGLALVMVAALGLLADLGGLSLRQWDEARMAVSALEMTRSGNYLVATFGGVPDLWNTKPPLLLWLQAGLLQLLGPTEWAVRLPSALAALAVLGLVYWVMARFLRRPVGALLAVSVLLSTLGFIGKHHAHTGDYDALLTLAELTLGLSVLLVLETGRPGWWVGVGAGLVVGGLTKGVAILLPLPGLAIYCLLQPKGRQLLRQPGFWLVALVWAALMVGWYLLREHQAPGYWAAVNANELGGRFGHVLENHQEPWYYYLARLVQAKFLPWVFLLPLVLPFALRHPDGRARRLAWLALSWALGLLLVLSLSRTKIDWYMAPAYPWLALLVGLGGPRLATWLLGRVRGGVGRLGLRLLLLALLLVPPFITIGIEQRNNWQEDGEELRVGYGLRALRAEPRPPQPLAVVAAPGFYQALRPITAEHGHVGYDASLRFYVETYPGPVRVVSPAEAPQLRGPGYVLTATAADSVLMRLALPHAVPRAAGRQACWLWALPPSR